MEQQEETSIYPDQNDDEDQSRPASRSNTQSSVSEVDLDILDETVNANSFNQEISQNNNNPEILKNSEQNRQLSSENSRQNLQNDSPTKSLSYDGLPIYQIYKDESFSFSETNEPFDLYSDHAFEKTFSMKGMEANLNSESTSPDPLFVGAADRTQAIKYLSKSHNGGYCVRKKTADAKKPYVISVKIDDISINHLWVRVALHSVWREAKDAEDTQEKENERIFNEYRGLGREWEDFLENLVLSNSNFENNKILELRHGYHIDSGTKFFESMLDLLKHYEGQDLSQLFHNCSVSLKSLFDLSQYEFKSGQNKRKSDSIVNRSEIKNMENQTSTKNYTITKDNSISNEHKNTEINGTLSFSNKEFKIINEAQVAYPFDKFLYEDLIEEDGVVDKLEIGWKIRVLEKDHDVEENETDDVVENATIDDSWVKVFIDCSEFTRICYVPKNFLKYDVRGFVPAF